MDLHAVADQLTTPNQTETVTDYEGGITITSPTEDLRRIAVPTRDEVQAVFRDLAKARAELEGLDRRRAQMGIA